jgi:hypothetical protein
VCLLDVARDLVDDSTAARVTPVGAWEPRIVGGGWPSIEGRKVDLPYRGGEPVTGGSGRGRSGFPCTIRRLSDQTAHVWAAIGRSEFEIALSDLRAPTESCRRWRRPDVGPQSTRHVFPLRR